MKLIGDFKKPQYIVIVFYNNPKDHVEVFTCDSDKDQELLFNRLDNNDNVKSWKEMQIGIDY